MNVLVATPWLPPRGGGLERYAFETSRDLARRGHEVTILGHSELPIEEAREGVRLVGVAPRLRLSNTPLGLTIAREAKRRLRGGPHDVASVHTPVPGTAELVALQARRAGVPFALTYHAGVLAAPPGALTLAARVHRLAGERWMIARAASRIAVAPYVAQRVFRGRECVVVPPGVDADRFSPAGEPVPGRILFVGPVDRAYAWKGLATLVEAFEILSASAPDAHLRLVGRGDLEAHYRARLAMNNLADRFSIAGRVGDAQLVDEYRAASVVVLPSTSPAESFGMALAEANACGRPVVGRDVGGIPSFVRPYENGLLAPPGDAQALADAILEILADASLARKLGERGREKVLAAHRWDAIGARTEAALAQAAAQRVR
jgi:glycosyltransferase involved in cell wall biosynthesis